MRLLLALAFGLGSAMAFGQTAIDNYNLVWHSPSKNAAGSMPVGNGEVGLNVWVEENGDLLFYVARTDAWSETARLLKLCRFRLKIEPNTWTSDRPFRQILHLREGRIRAETDEVEVDVMVDAEKPVIWVSGRSLKSKKLTLSLETWRTERRKIEGQEQDSSWTMAGAPFELWESADVYGNDPGAVELYHRNESTPVPFTLRHQGLETLAGLVKDPYLDRTFGCRLSAKDFKKEGNSRLTKDNVKNFQFQITTHVSQPAAAAEWLTQIRQAESTAGSLNDAKKRTDRWWKSFWDRSWIFVEGDDKFTIPSNTHPLRVGVDSAGGNKFVGEWGRRSFYARPLPPDQVRWLSQTRENEDLPENPLPESDYKNADLSQGFTCEAWIKPEAGHPIGRIFDKLTAGTGDGFLFDMHPGYALRAIVGSQQLTVPNALTPGEWAHVALTVDPIRGQITLYKNGVPRKSSAEANIDGISQLTQKYILQRWVQACGGRGAYPIKFNGSIFTTEPDPLGPKQNPDWRRWGDCYWWQNTRLPYEPMLATGDFEMMEPLFRLHEVVLPLCEARAKLYHGVQGGYYPETMTIFGTYANRDYGWKREGHEPKEVLSPWWQYAWNQGLELVYMMLERYAFTGDSEFFTKRVVPMAKSVLAYFDTRFPRDANGKLKITPTQSVETYWEDVVNDTPCVAGLHAVLDRLVENPLLDPSLKFAWIKLKNELPEVPVKEGKILPAESFNPKRSNVENPEFYAIWPFRIYGVGRPGLRTAQTTFRERIEKANAGWQYDGQTAAYAGLADEARETLVAKAQNSNPNYRFPAMWGPNYDWLPDQCHGSNLMTTLQSMILQWDEEKIYVLPAWPEAWDLKFKLHAPKKTVVEGEYKSGKLVRLKVTPKEREKDVVKSTD